MNTKIENNIIDDDKFNPVPYDDEKFMARINSAPEMQQSYLEVQKEFAIIDAIIDAIEQSGLTQNELAERMGTKQSSISRLLNGRRSPTWKTADKIFKATGRTITKIVTEPIKEQ